MKDYIECSKLTCCGETLYAITLGLVSEQAKVMNKKFPSRIIEDYLLSIVGGMGTMDNHNGIIYLEVLA